MGGGERTVEKEVKKRVEEKKKREGGAKEGRGDRRVTAVELGVEEEGVKRKREREGGGREREREREKERDRGGGGGMVGEKRRQRKL